MKFRDLLQSFCKSPYVFAIEQSFLLNMRGMLQHDLDARTFWDALNREERAWEDKHREPVFSGFVHSFARSFEWPADVLPEETSIPTTRYLGDNLMPIRIDPAGLLKIAYVGDDQTEQEVVAVVCRYLPVSVGGQRGVVVELRIDPDNQNPKEPYECHLGRLKRFHVVPDRLRRVKPYVIGADDEAP